MSSPENAPVSGTIGWIDLTSPQAEELREFYERVVGWTSSPVQMEGYSDHMMNGANGDAVAGVCHAKGANAEMPPIWMIYIYVDDLADSIRQCTELGGVLIQTPRQAGGGQFAVLKDPAGTVFAAYQAG